MSLTRRVEQLFAAEGPLDRRWPRYERRASQVELSVAIARAMEFGGVLLAEAPTGVGKSLAYLAPAVLHALESGRRVVVATCTRSLQDQLVERDLPALLGALDASVPHARLKGKQNYVCPRALDLEDAVAPEEAELLESLKRWAASDTEGDLDRFATTDPEGFRRLRSRVAADPNACTTVTCRRGRECFWARARREASSAQLLVVNHALLALSADNDGLLPEFDTLIVDEAHRLESVLLGQLERGVSRHRFEELFRLLGGVRASRRRGAAREAAGFLARLRTTSSPLFAGAEGTDTLDRLAKRVADARADVSRLFDSLAEPAAKVGPYAFRRRYRSTAGLLGGDLGTLELVLQHCGEFARGLNRMAEAAGRGDSTRTAEIAAEAEQLASRFSVLGSDLEALTDPTRSGWVYWRTASPHGAELHGAPVTAGEHARRLVLGRARTTVFTSATLSSGGDFSFLAGRLGLGESWGVPYETHIAPSPFSLERQMRAYILEGDRGEAETVADVVAALAKSGRNQLVLFTAHERLRRARELLQARLPASSLLLAQEWDGPAGLVSERFRAERGAILLGVQSLWEGVDFPGEALEIVVVAKLPFAVPDDPVVEARAERLRERDLDPFREDAVPEAVLRFRQGIGRLIRRADDRGVVVVCDSRLAGASYREAFLGALAVTPSRWNDAVKLAADAARFLAEPLVVEEKA